MNIGIFKKQVVSSNHSWLVPAFKPQASLPAESVHKPSFEVRGQMRRALEKSEDGDGSTFSSHWGGHG